MCRVVMQLDQLSVIVEKRYRPQPRIDQSFGSLSHRRLTSDTGSYRDAAVGFRHAAVRGDTINFRFRADDLRDRLQ